MGERGVKKKGSESASSQHTPTSIRQEISGRKQTNSLKSIAKLQHLKYVALWVGGEGSIPSLGALLGRRFAARGEALGIHSDPSLFPCQKCETILQPDFNCTVRVVKNGEKTRRRPKRPMSATQNNVVYKCHFCTYNNLKRGTPKGHMKEVCPPKPKQPSKPAESARKKQGNSASGEGAMKKAEVEKPRETSSPSAGNKTLSAAENSPTPSKALTLLDSKKRKRNKAKPKKADELEVKSAMADAKGTGLTSGRRRRKCRTTLKEIAENSERERSRNFSTFSIPFTGIEEAFRL